MSDHEETGLMHTEDAKAFFAFYGVTLITFSESTAPFQNPRDLREHVAILLGDAIQQSSECLLMTADKRMYRDCAVAARTIFETLVNILYIMASDVTEAQRMVDHANMKMARDLERRVQAGSVSYTTRHPLKDVILDDPGFKEIWDKFSDSENREQREWTTKNIQKRLRIIEEKFGKKVTHSLVFPFENYRFASEVIHGTIYSVLYSRNLVLTSQNVPVMERVKGVDNRILSLLLGLGAALGHAARVLANDEISEQVHNKIDKINETFQPEFREFVERNDGAESDRE